MQKPKSFRPWQPEQTTLLPPSPSDWLSDDHQVYFLLDLVDELDLSQVLIPAQSKDPRGEKGFDPRMMTMLLLYAYCVGIVSSRKIERACYEDLAFRVLTGNQQPDHSRVSEFRRRNLDALRGLFVQILRLCQKAGMVSLGHVALDGTKVQANASKHKAMSHERIPGFRGARALEERTTQLNRFLVVQLSGLGVQPMLRMGFPRFCGQVRNGHAMTTRLSIDNEAHQNPAPVHGATEGGGGGALPGGGTLLQCRRPAPWRFPPKAWPAGCARLSKEVRELRREKDFFRLAAAHFV
ncbi:transposase [Synechococcus sp. 1G10]|uniref:transposase n=1 Tax=Synechococcus sp. 1G10 TaxID=2025605 RepID=UPI000B980DED|nr:transposase [Synechococcus sp. 1G10]